MEKRRVNVRAIVWGDNKIFAVKLKEKNGKARDYWCLPGGGLDPLESFEAGLTRELVEELGVAPKVGRVLFGQQMKTSRMDFNEELELFYHVTNPEDFSYIDLSKTSHGVEEIAEYGFIDPSTERLLPAFLQTIDIAKFVNTVQPVYITDNFNE